MRLFETQIVKKRLGVSKGLRDEIKKTALALPELDAEGVRWSKRNYPGGYTSYASLSAIHRQFSVFDRLKEALDQEVILFARSLGFQKKDQNLSLTSLWVNLMPEGCYHAFHMHPHSVVSGTFYVEVPKGAAPLRIEDPRAPLFMASPIRKIQQDLHPKSGEIILFESWLKHEVPPNRSRGERISVSFNYERSV